MQGKTHIAVGVAATLAITQPTTPSTLVASIGTAMCASLLPDIDIESSVAHKRTKVIGTIFGLAIATIIVGAIYGLFTFDDVLEKIKTNNLTIGIVLFLTTLSFGLLLPHLKFRGLVTGHRTFTHSILSLLFFSLSIHFVFPEMYLPFTIAYISHIVIDLLNKKKCKILWPLKCGISFNICKSNGATNKVMCILGTISSIGLIAFYIIKMYFVI